MKIILTCIVLLSSIQYAYADITLEFKEVVSKDLLTYYIKDEQLKFIQSEENRFNLFNQQQQQFISIDLKTAQSAMINENVLNQRISQLNQQRLKKLAQVEHNLNKKLKTMSSTAREVGESLVNVLKYPEVYGEHTQLIVKKSEKSRKILDIPCQVFQLYRAKQLLRDFCVADASSLKILPEDYQTLRSYYAFNYNTQSRLMLAMGKTRFSLIDYEQQKITGVIIESIDYQGAKVTEHLILNSINIDKLPDSGFKLPNLGKIDQ